MPNEGDQYLYRVLLTKVEEIRKAEQGIRSMYSGYSDGALEILKEEFLDVVESYEYLQKHRGEEVQQLRGPSLFTADAVVEAAKKLNASVDKVTERNLRNRFEEVKETGATIPDVLRWINETPQLFLVPAPEAQKPKL